MTTSNNLPSPFATGGGGHDLERRVGAFYLALLLIKATPRGQNSGITNEVRFQRAYQAEPLDDLVVVSRLSSREAKLSLQIKRDLAFGKADQDFDKVLRACWGTFKSPQFNPITDRLGIAIGLYSKTIDEHYQSVLTWARDSANATDFSSRISQGPSNKPQRSFYELIKNKLISYGGTGSDDELWSFLRSMVILDFDFQKDGSRDSMYAIQMLKSVLPPDKQDLSSSLFRTLFDYTAASKTAGSFNLETLTERLISDGIPLIASVDCHNDLERLNEHNEFILKSIRTDIGGVVLNRVPVVIEARERVRKVPLLELVGPPGTGKSTILKALIQSQKGEGPLIALDANRVNGAGWHGFANNLQLQKSLREILLAISTSPQPCIFINDADRITDQGARLVVNDLIRTMAEMPLSLDGSRRWTLVLSSREENLQELHKWLEWRVLGEPETLLIPELTLEEIEIVIDKNRRLRPLLFLELLGKIIKNPFMLSLLTDQRMLPNPDAPPPIATEIEVSVVWWQNLVGSSGAAGIARKQALLEMGERLIKNSGKGLTGQGIPAEALYSLSLDNILIQDRVRDVYHLRHDLYEDWILYRTLDSKRDVLPTFLLELGQPFGILRALQLLGLSVLEFESADVWIELFKRVELANELAPRWRQALLIAPLLSSRADNLLDEIKGFLLEDNSRRLVDLLITVRTVEVNPDFSLRPIAEELGVEPENMESFLLNRLIPRWVVWMPLIRWLIRQANELQDNVRPEAARLMEIWQRITSGEDLYRKEIADIAYSWLEQVERRHLDD